MNFSSSCSGTSLCSMLTTRPWEPFRRRSTCGTTSWPRRPRFELLAVLDALQRDLASLREQALEIALPSLRNLEAGRSLASELTSRPIVDPLAHDEKLEPWLRSMLPQVREVHLRLRTLHYKNLGALLSLHERIESR